jgi:hypothetical protein
MNLFAIPLNKLKMSFFKKTSILLSIIVVLSSCEEEVEPLGPCEGPIWASATKNGDDLCLGTVTLINWFANTEQSKIDITAGTTNKASIPEIEASFKVPVAGIAINTSYPLIEGRIAGADKFTEGSLTFINYSGGCIAGTFELKAVDSLAGVTQTYTNGKFVINGSAESNCNPFN